MKKILFICAALLTMSCVKEAMTGNAPVCGNVPVTVEFAETKTAITGKQVTFVGGEFISLVCDGVNAAQLTNKGTSVNKFSGVFNAVGQTKNDASFYAIYPYVGLSKSGNETCFLSMTQKAPFDGAANFMCSDKVTAAYNEAQMPSLSMNMNQLLGILKISFTNSSADYQNDLVKEVILTASTPLTGEFTVKFDAQGKPAVDFAGNNNRALSSFLEPVALGLGKTHEVHLSVNPSVIKNAEITVRTDKHIFTRKAKADVNVPAGSLTFMDPMDVATTFTSAEAKVKTLVLWGDSYTNRGQEYTHVDECNYAYHLGKMLGSGWKIYNGGCSGDVTNTIAARQGGIQMNIGASDFTIPATCTPVNVGGVYSNRNYYFTENTYTQIARYGLINPCEIVVEDADGNEIARIEGTVSHNSSDYTKDVTFTRTTPGEAITVPAKSKLVTFAAKNLRNPDLTIIYMGQNGGFKSLDILYQQYRAMIDYAFPEGPENYIVLGFHNHNTLKTWNADNAYWNFFDGPNGFGVNEAAGRPVSRFVNLYKELTGENYKDYLTISGAAVSPADVSQEDINYVSKGMIPASYWYCAPLEDIHPNEKGGKAFATAIYKKIVELGYLD